jgi:hypothetical protein
MNSRKINAQRGAGAKEVGFGGEACGLPHQEPHARGDGGRAQGEEEHLRGHRQGHRGDL